MIHYLQTDLLFPFQEVKEFRAGVRPAGKNKSRKQNKTKQTSKKPNQTKTKEPPKTTATKPTKTTPTKKQLKKFLVGGPTKYFCTGLSNLP